MGETDPNYGISRLDQEAVGTRGWQVRFQRKGVRYGRFFSDSSWGGTENALQRARQFRDRLLARAQRSERTAQASSRSHTGTTARNRSGVVGVTRIVQRSSAGSEYHFWQASWMSASGVRETVRYSVLKHGDETAFELACRARRKALQ
ncbi:MAG: AP2 domain-containing protein [Verrucomicrobiota bacterium]